VNADWQEPGVELQRITDETVLMALETTLFTNKGKDKDKNFALLAGSIKS